MKNYSVRKYEVTDFELWNAFISKAKNATFLFHRDFMDYHKDKFDDFSLLVFENEKLVSVLPANIVEKTIFSHQGLTYGGLIYSEKIKLIGVIDIFKTILIFLNQNNINTILLKRIPNIYTSLPSEELLYPLFLVKSKLIRRDSMSVINLTKPFSISKGRFEGINKGIQNKLKIIEEPNFEGFWNEILIPNLKLKHQAEPVHSVNEIKMLNIKFPKQIRQFNVYSNNKIVAGTTIFETESVAHSQYISGDNSKNELGSLDYLYHYLITDVFKDKDFFDFGTSNEDQGKKINGGLNFWKESFGASTVCQDFYEIETANFNLLENIVL
ncbi:GNAT family N-acetyltransferase [Flavobacterium sp.]|uniref:GNAT family N-acetyltransferase n=1 Tax=Flavobacterium sp. TaxID=239 RepID=UPI00286ADCC0|nr:GNAT family N-acetyltransferase [Flavobacterium sp.]